MNEFPTKIQRIIDEGYTFRFGDYISEGFNIALKNIGGYIGFFLVYVAMAFGSLLLPIIGSLALMVIAPALIIGPYHVAHLIANQKDNQFGDFFKGFDRFGPLFLTWLLTVVLVLAAAIPGILLLGYTLFSAFSNLEPYAAEEDAFAQFLSGGDSPMLIAGALLYILPVLYLGVSFIWAPMLVWFYKLEPWPALMASRKITANNWWITLAFLIVVGIIAGLGLIALGVGILLTAPAMLCAQYAAFAGITGLNEETPETDLIDHFAPGG